VLFLLYMVGTDDKDLITVKSKCGLYFMVGH
jgi:hypothetical protein